MSWYFITGFLTGYSNDQPAGSESIITNWITSGKEYKRTISRQGFSPVLRLIGFDWHVIQDLHRNINLWSDADVLAWKSSYIANCNAITVAAAIFATFGLSALQLPNVNDVHWSVRALFSISMLSGIQSVVSATTQQRIIGSINQAMTLRVYLSRGSPKSTFYGTRTTSYPKPYSTYPLEISAASTMVLDFPRLNLNLSVFMYLAGFFLYLILSWTQGASGTAIEYRNVFIVFLLFGISTVVWYCILGVARLSDMTKAAFDFDAYGLGAGLDESEKVRSLEDSLKGHQQPTEDLAGQIKELTKAITDLRRSLGSQLPHIPSSGIDEISVLQTIKQ